MSSAIVPIRVWPTCRFRAGSLPFIPIILCVGAQTLKNFPPYTVSRNHRSTPDSARTVFCCFLRHDRRGQTPGQYSSLASLFADSCLFK